MSGGDITRDRTKLAFATGENDSTLTIYSVPLFPTRFKDGDADPGSKPIVCYRYSGPSGGAFSTPTFAPEGSRVAWSEGDGINVATVPSFGGGCTTEGASQTAALLIPGGKQPDWGPADVPAGRGATGGAWPPKAAKAKLAKALAKGLSVRVTVPSAGRVSAAATRSGRKVAAGGKSVKAGAAKVKLRFTRRRAPLAQALPQREAARSRWRSSPRVGPCSAPRWR